MRRILVFLTLTLMLFSVSVAGAQSGATATVTGAFALNVRTAPTTQAGVLAVVGLGDAYQVTGRTSDAAWWQVSLRPQGLIGWVLGSYVQISNAHVVPVVNAPAPTPVAFATGRVNTARLNIRATPDPINGAIVHTVSQGDVLVLVSKTTGIPTWYQVQNPLGGLGWVNGNYLNIANDALVPVSGGIILPPTPTPQPIPAVYGTVVNVYYLNVRSTPNPYVYNNILTIIARNQSYPVIGRNTDATWYQIVLPNGVAGWVRSKYFSVASPFTLPITG